MGCVEPPRAHEDVIADCLTRLGIAERPQRFELRSECEPASYLLVFAVRHAVLKWTPAAGAPAALESARRELHFHHRLAPHVPLAIPRLLASADDASFGVCGLWTAHSPAKPAVFWMEADLLEAVEQLAQLHAAYWQRVGRLAEHEYLRRATPDVLEGRIREAYAAWRGLKADGRYSGVLTDQTFAALREALLEFAAVEKASRALPATLVHGDPRADNLQRGATGHLVWAGWGNVGIGRGADDLAALFRSLAAGGASAPPPRALAHYHAQLRIVLGDVAPMVAIQRALDAAELRDKLLDAPARLAGGLVQPVADTAFRALALARKLDVL